MFHVLNHATFKASLFMIAGIVDHENPPRDIRQLGGLWKFMPWNGHAGDGGGGDGGVPLTNGFLSRRCSSPRRSLEPSGLYARLVPVGHAGWRVRCRLLLRFVHDTFSTVNRGRF